MTTSPAEQAVDLLQRLVRIPSVSGEEEACRDMLAAWLGRHGLDTTIHGRNVVGVLEGTAPVTAPGAGRGLLLCTHIDVVPVGPGWTRDPWDGAIEGGRLHGRGSNDAKSSVAAMAVAAANLHPRSFAGRLVVAFVCDEETGGEGIEACGGDLPAVDATVVGEPTELDVCPGQRGLLRARLVAHGRSCHASRPHEGRNALEIAARDIVALSQLDLGEADPVLGRATLQATVCNAGTRSNVVPGEAVVELDGRPTPQCGNEAMVERIRAAVESELVVKSARLHPVSTPTDAEIVRLATEASPTGRVRGFGGMSDMVHLAHLPGVVMGPGTSEQSHAPDESVALEQVALAVDAYATIARRFLGVRAPASAAAEGGAS